MLDLSWMMTLDEKTLHALQLELVDAYTEGWDIKDARLARRSERKKKKLHEAIQFVRFVMKEREMKMNKLGKLKDAALIAAALWLVVMWALVVFGVFYVIWRAVV